MRSAVRYSLLSCEHFPRARSGYESDELDDFLYILLELRVESISSHGSNRDMTDQSVHLHSNPLVLESFPVFKCRFIPSLLNSLEERLPQEPRHFELKNIGYRLDEIHFAFACVLGHGRLPVT